MGDARRRRALNAESRGLKASTLPNVRPCHTLALIDRRIEKQDDGEIRFSSHSAKPGRYASADLRNLYQWDGKMLRKLDRRTLQVQNTQT